MNSLKIQTIKRGLPVFISLAVFVFSWRYFLPGLYAFFAPVSFALDADVYTVCGQAFLQHGELYNYAWDHKGPLLYLFFALGDLLSPGRTSGVVFLSFLSLFVGSLFAYRTLRLFLLPLLAFVGLFLVALFFAGAQTVNPTDLLAASQICFFYYYLKEKDRHSRGLAFLTGICVALALWTKFNIVVFYVPFVLHILWLQGRHQVGAMLAWLAYSALGFAAISLPMLALLCFSGSMEGMLDAYFRFNLSYASQGTPILLSDPMAVLGGLFSESGLLRSALHVLPAAFPAWAAVALLGASSWAAYRLLSRNALRSHFFVSLIGGGLFFILCFKGSYNFGHYYSSFLPFYYLFAAALLALLPQPRRFFSSLTGRYVSLFVALLLSAMLFLLGEHRYRKFIQPQNINDERLVQEMLPVVKQYKSVLIISPSAPGLYARLRLQLMSRFFYQPAVSDKAFPHMRNANREILSAASADCVLADEVTAEEQALLDQHYVWLRSLGRGKELYIRK